MARQVLSGHQQYERMQVDIIAPSNMFSEAELLVMEQDGELFRFLESFASFGFIDCQYAREKYLKIMFNKRARVNTSSALWVKTGEGFFSRLELVDDR